MSFYWGSFWREPEWHDECHSDKGHSGEFHSKNNSAECHSAESNEDHSDVGNFVLRHSDECCLAQCHSADWHSSESHFATSHSAGSYCAQCHSADWHSSVISCWLLATSIGNHGEVCRWQTDKIWNLYFTFVGWHYIAKGYPSTNIYKPNIMLTSVPGSVIFNGREPKSCLGQVFKFKLGSLTQ